MKLKRITPYCNSYKSIRRNDRHSDETTSQTRLENRLKIEKTTNKRILTAQKYK